MTPNTPADVASLPANCRQRLMHEGKAYPRSGCAACGKWMPRAKECEAALAKPASGDGLPAAERICATAKHSHYGKSLAAMLRDEVVIGDFREALVGLVHDMLRRLATPEQPGSAVQGEANADRWVAVKPAGAPYWGIHTETGETIAGTSSGLSEGAAKRIVALHNNELCEADDLLRELGLDPIRFRSEGGWLNAGKIRAALLHPQDYADLYTTPPPAPAAEQGGREADRRRFPDPDFNAWLDQGISDCGHTVWDAVGDVQAAWQGWEAAILAQPEARGVEGKWLRMDSCPVGEKVLLWNQETEEMFFGHKPEDAPNEEAVVTEFPHTAAWADAWMPRPPEPEGETNDEGDR